MLQALRLIYIYIYDAVCMMYIIILINKKKYIKVTNDAYSRHRDG